MSREETNPAEEESKSTGQGREGSSTKSLCFQCLLRVFVLNENPIEDSDTGTQEWQARSFMLGKIARDSGRAVNHSKATGGATTSSTATQTCSTTKSTNQNVNQASGQKGTREGSGRDRGEEDGQEGPCEKCGGNHSTESCGKAQHQADHQHQEVQEDLFPELALYFFIDAYERVSAYLSVEDFLNHIFFGTYELF